MTYEIFNPSIIVKNFVIIRCVLIFFFYRHESHSAHFLFFFPFFFLIHPFLPIPIKYLFFPPPTNVSILQSSAPLLHPKDKYISFTHQRLYSSALLLHPKDKKKPKEEEASSSLKPRRYFFGKDYFIFVRTSPMVYVNPKFFL